MLAEKIKILWQQIRGHRLWGTRIENVILGVLLVGLLWTLFAHFRTPSVAQAATDIADEIVEIDDMLPEGFVLFPLEFANQAALDPLIGDYAVVNVYRTGSDGEGRGRLVAKNVKVMRAPQNPQMLAALIPENQVAGLMGEHSGFYGVLQRRSTARDFQRAETARRKPSLVIENFEN